jgi:hypothetical protein
MTSNDGIETMWNKAVLAWFKVLSRNLPGVIEENQK